MKTVKKDVGYSERTFMSGVLVLSASTIIVKIIGLAYKIPLMAVLGAEGMGYFNSAYEIYALLCGVSTSGLPIAVSMLVSSSMELGDVGRVRRIFRTSSTLMLTKGVLVSGILAVAASPIANAIGNRDAYYAILAISPALLFSCVASAIRGYFQGLRKMTPTAVSQLLEAIGKLVFGAGLAVLAVMMGMGLPLSAAFAVLGVSLGSLLSATFLVIRKKTYGSDSSMSKKNGIRGHCFWELLRISLPITVGAALMGSIRIIDMALIMRRLQDMGVSVSQANKIYGSYTTLALPIYGLVPAFIPPITESLIPRLSAAVGVDGEAEQKRAVGNAFRLTVFLAVPASMGIIIYSEQIISLLFHNQAEAVAIASPLLSALGVSVLFCCIISTANAILQSYRHVFLPIIALGVGMIVKAVSAYFLIGNPDVGAMGAPVSTFLSNAAVLTIDLAFVVRAVPKGTGIFRQLPKPIFASVVAMAASYAVFLPLRRITDSITVQFGGVFLTAAGVYILLSCLLGVVSKDDIFVFTRKNKKQR